MVFSTLPFENPLRYYTFVMYFSILLKSTLSSFFFLLTFYSRQHIKSFQNLIKMDDPDYGMQIDAVKEFKIIINCKLE